MMIRLTDTFACVCVALPEWTYKTLVILAISGSGSRVHRGQGAVVSVLHNRKSPLWFVCLTLHHFPITVSIKSQILLAVCKVLCHRTPPSLPCLFFSSFPSWLGLLSFPQTPFFSSHGLHRCCSSAWNTPPLCFHLPNSLWSLRQQVWDPFINVNFATSPV